MKVLIIFGSTTGLTEMASEQVELGLVEENIEVERRSVIDCVVEDLDNYDVTLLGVSTWDYGCLQYDFELFHDRMLETNFSGKKFAVFGTGDKSYGDTYCEAVRTVAKTIRQQGGELIIENLEIESDLTDERLQEIKNWAKEIIRILK